MTKRIDEPRTRLVVHHRLDESETASGRIRYAAIAMERDHALPGYDFEPVLVAAADIAAVDAVEQIFRLGKSEAEAVRCRRREVPLKGGDLEAFRWRRLPLLF